MLNLIKRCSCISLLISMIMLNCFTVYATETDKIYASCESDLRKAVKTARPYQEIVLLKDICINKIIEIDRPLTIDLNDKKVSFENDACFLVGNEYFKVIEYTELVPQHYENSYKQVEVKADSYINEYGVVVRRPDFYRNVIEKVWHEPQYVDEKKFHAGYYHTIYKKEIVDGKYYEVDGKLKKRPSWVRIVKVPINNSRSSVAYSKDSHFHATSTTRGNCNEKIDTYTPPTRGDKTVQKNFHATSTTRDNCNEKIDTYTPPTRGDKTVRKNFHATSTTRGTCNETVNTYTPPTGGDKTVQKNFHAVSTTRTDNREDLINNAKKEPCEQKYIIKEEVISGKYYEENGQLKKYPSWTRTVEEKVWNEPYFTIEKTYQPGYYEDVVKKVKVDGEYYIDDNGKVVNRPAFYRTVQEKVLVPEKKVWKVEVFHPKDIRVKILNGKIVSKNGEDGKLKIHGKDGKNASRAPLRIISGNLVLKKLSIKSGDGGNGASGNKHIGKKGGNGGNGANIIEVRGITHISYDDCIFKPGLKGKGGKSNASTFIGRLFARNGKNGTDGIFIKKVAIM